MTVLSRRSVHLLALLFLYRTTAKGEENEPEASPYVLDREWKQLLDADPPVDKELRDEIRRKIASLVATPGKECRRRATIATYD